MLPPNIRPLIEPLSQRLKRKGGGKKEEVEKKKPFGLSICLGKKVREEGIVERYLARSEEGRNKPLK